MVARRWHEGETGSDCLKDMESPFKVTEKSWGHLAGSVGRARDSITGVLSSSPTLRVEPTLKIKIKKGRGRGHVGGLLGGSFS